MKQCFKCQRVLPLSEFYKHPQMADGHVNKCKECNKKDVLEHRLNNLEKIREYDRKRGNRQTPEYRSSLKKNFPTQWKAQHTFSNAVRGKKMKREPCEVCGADYVHGHHDDYAYPLTVRWLCPAHHKQWHRDNGEALNRI